MQPIKRREEQFIGEEPLFPLARGFPAWPVIQCFSHARKGRLDTLARQQPVHGSQRFHSKRRLETVDECVSFVDRVDERRPVGGCQIRSQGRRSIRLKVNGVERRGISQPLVAVEIAAIKGVEQVG